MELKNYTEVIAKQVLEDLISTGKIKSCTCEKCRLDIMAKALNNLPNSYYVSDKGQVFSKLRSTYLDNQTKVLTEILKASIDVEKEPRHT